jgi:IMP dehydrogenase
MVVRDVLDEVNRTVFTIDADKTVEDAINLMSEKETAALIATENENPVGIITERDVVACYIKFNRKPFNEIKIKRAMSGKLVVARPEDELAPTISMMTKLDIRHLPVMEGGKISAVLPICDMVQHQVGTLSSELRYLEDYLADLQEAVTD